MNFQQAKEELATARNPKNGKPLANNTRLFQRSDDTYAIRLHNTDIVEIRDDGTYRLNTGGWQTITTKDRIKRFSPAHIWSEKGIWYVGAMTSPFSGQRTVFFDGMIVDANGDPTAKKLPDAAKVQSQKEKLDKLCRTYVKGYAQHVKKDGLQQPGPGDCLGCVMAADDKTGPMGGLQPMGTDHILSHFEERYYVPSLFWKALVSHGYRDPSLIWQMAKDEVEKGKTTWVSRELSAYLRKLKPSLMKDMEENNA